MGEAAMEPFDPERNAMLAEVRPVAKLPGGKWSLARLDVLNAS